ncbi:hypothetical protein [Oceaniglobus roseus]|uniref:hypothetical protein n=1 Tax=Oceaniglobus roseus TaxID=1737570 RepID=UPI000C7F4AD3|nr:hypothetical protein [Kandeliimicrobium roseum]
MSEANYIPDYARQRLGLGEALMHLRRPVACFLLGLTLTAMLVGVAVASIALADDGWMALLPGVALVYGLFQLAMSRIQAWDSDR